MVPLYLKISIPSLRQRTFVLLLLLVISSTALAVELRPIDDYQLDPASEKWRWQQVEGIEGTDLGIVKMGPDDRLGIINGPSRLMVYDGLQIQGINPPDDTVLTQINAFGISSDGVYCIVTSTAIFLLEEGLWTQVSKSGLGRRVNNGVIETSDGLLWAGTREGIARIDPRTRTCDISPFPNTVISICEGPGRQSLWISTAPTGEVWECPLVEGKLVSEDQWIRRSEGLGRQIRGVSLMRSSDGRIWHINNTHNLPASFYDPQKGDWQEVNLSDLGGDNFDFSIMETPDGAIWISSRGTLHVLKNGNWQIYHSPEYPLPGARSTLFQDSKGFVYVAEASGMNVRIDYSQRLGLAFNNLHFQTETVDGDLLFISADDEVVHLAPGEDLAEIHGSHETGIGAPGALIAHSNGHWILAGSNERQAAVSIWDGETWTPYFFPEVSPSFGHLSLFEHSNGDIWIGCAQLEEEFPQYKGGIVVLSPQDGGTYGVRHLWPPEYSFRNWSLNEGSGGEVYSSGNGLFANSFNGSEVFELPETLHYKWIDQVAADQDGRLWIALWSFGVFSYDKGQWRQFTEADGLESLMTSFIICLDGKDPVATTREGHFRFDGTRWAPYMGIHDGLHRGSGRLVQGRNGSIWTNHTHVDWYYRGQRPEAYSGEKKRGFRTVQYIPDTIAPETRWAQAPPELTQDLTLHFKWTGMDVWSRSLVEGLHYSYRVDEGAWSPFLPATELALDDLKGGAHSIEIRARDSDFNIDSTPLRAAALTIQVPLASASVSVDAGSMATSDPSAS